MAVTGVNVLQGDCRSIGVNGNTITFCGVDDPDSDVYESHLKRVCDQITEEGFHVLLAHRPERIEEYLECPFDLILSGHAHGGQWRLPGIINGLYAPHQGLFPKYAGGRYDFEDAVFVVSRGLARESTKIPRMFNRPELVVTHLVPVG
jgi:predicted MPP superfamily phosphohydrolase